MDEQDTIVIPQIPLGLHTDGHTERKETTCTLVMYATTLQLVKKWLPSEITLNMEEHLEWNEKEERICWSTQNLKEIKNLFHNILYDLHHLHTIK